MMIQDYRTQIDLIDDQLLNLLNERAKLVAHIAALKAAAGIPLLDRSRERKILARVLQANSGPLDAKTTTKIFRCIINEIRRAQTYATQATSLEVKNSD